MRLCFAAALLIPIWSFAVQPTPAHAEDDAAADIAFWQSIQADKDPAEYRAYLSAFPNGRFAALARIRLGEAQPADNQAGNAGDPGAANPARATPHPVGTTPFRVDLLPKQQPAAEGADGDDQDLPAAPPEQIVVTPAKGRVGQIIQFECLNFPDPLPSDKIVVVPVGSPEMDPSRDPADTKVVWGDYARNCKRTPSKGGPFPPGRYEVRFMTGLYNIQHTYETKARSTLSIR